MGIDSIIALAKRKPVSAGQAKQVLGQDDLLVSIPKFTSQSARKRYPEARWNSLPEAMLMRQIKVNIAIPGYRSKTVYLLTTLLDKKHYPVEVITELYRQRWQVELNFRDLKTTLGMEFLPSKTPEIVQKQIQMFFIAYNIIRLLIIDSSGDSLPSDFSFKSCVQTVLSYSSILCKESMARASSLLIELRTLLSQCLLFKRPHRVEPRVVKRRPKPFKLMMKPRDILRAEMMADPA